MFGEEMVIGFWMPLIAVAVLAFLGVAVLMRSVILWYFKINLIAEYNKRQAQELIGINDRLQVLVSMSEEARREQRKALAKLEEEL